MCWVLSEKKINPLKGRREIMQQDIKRLLWTNNEYLLSFLHDKSQTAIVHTNLDIANRPGKLFLFTISNILYLVNSQNRSWFFHYINKFIIWRFIISRFECTIENSTEYIQLFKTALMICSMLDHLYSRA